MRSKRVAKIVAFFLVWLVVMTAALMAFFPTVRLYVSTNFTALVADVFITYGYYGEELSSVELTTLYENGDDLHCVQVPTETSNFFHMPNKFECFDTRAEAEAFTP